MLQKSKMGTKSKKKLILAENCEKKNAKKDHKTPKSKLFDEKRKRTQEMFKRS